MRNRWLALLLVVLASGVTAGARETHCAPAERVFFSCPIKGSSKVLSLCGGVDEMGTPLWLQYRFGMIGRTELVFPSDKAGSLQKFGGVRQTAKAIGLTIMEVWFAVGAYTYLIEHVYGGDCDGECTEANDLLVFERGGAVTRLACDSPVANGLWELYGHISDDQSMRP